MSTMARTFSKLRWLASRSERCSAAMSIGHSDSQSPYQESGKEALRLSAQLMRMKSKMPPRLLQLASGVVYFILNPDTN